MTKRIAILSTNQHLIPFGGLGQFIKGLTNHLSTGDFIVDLILDKFPTEDKFVNSLKLTGQVIYPVQVLSYQDHSNVFAFSDSVNFEKSINFRQSLMKALTTNIYDLLIVNSIEALDAVIATGIQEFVPTIVYTHLEFMLGQKNDTQPFSQAFVDYYSALMNNKKISIVTQTMNNSYAIKKTIGAFSNVVPMLIPEEGLLEPYSGQRKGILFNGRWEPRKRPQEFIKLIEQTGYAARVMTSKKSAEKFSNALRKIGCKDFIVSHSLIGQEKVDFIRQCKVQYHPSVLENFPFAVLEGITQLPVFVAKEKAFWHKNFEEMGFTLIHGTDNIREIYESNITIDNKWATDYQKMTKFLWDNLLKNLSRNPAKSLNNTFTQNDKVIYSDYITSLNRVPSIEDVTTVYNVIGNYNTYQFKEGTLCSKEPVDPSEYQVSTGIEKFFT